MGLPLNKEQAVLYGQCVRAAYALYLRDRNVLQPEPNDKDIPDPYELVAWLNMSDFILFDKTPKFYGFIARNRTACSTL